MYYVVNLETRNVLTYKEGDRMVFSVQDVASGYALRAQSVNDHPHAVVHIGNLTNSLGREKAPWL